MTVSSTNRRTGPYVGNGVTTLFPFDFKVFDKSDVLVTYTTSMGVDSPLVLDSDYSVTLNADQDNSPGGTILYPAATSVRPILSASEKLTFTGDLPETQPTDIPNLSPFFPDVVEKALDRNVILIQQLTEQVNRTLRFPVSGDGTGVVLPSAASRANTVLGFDSSGNPIFVIPTSGSVGDALINLANNTDPTKGAAMVGFIAPDGSPHKVSDLADANAIGNGDALIAVKQPFTGAGARTQHDKNAEWVMLTDMAGVKMNDSSAAVRTANSAALVSLLTQRKGVRLPEGVLWVAAGTPLTSFWNIEGAGAEATIIKGDGDLFSITSATNGEMRRFANLKIMNDVTSGKLISYVNVAPNNRVQFQNVNFDKATYHVYCAGGGESVSWSFHSCRFINASVESRHFEGLWVYREEACYSWYNRIGLRCTNGAVTSCSIDGGTYEQHDDAAIVLEASNVSFEIAAFRINAHFEVNGKVTNRADVAISTSVATRIQAITFSACGFYSPTPTQTNRISLTAGGGGGIDNIIVDGGAVTGTVPLTQNASAIKERNVYRQTGNPQNAAMVPQQVAYQYSQNYLGSVRVIGAAVGSGGVVASITPPAGTFLTRATVDGNIYNGVANSNTAQLIGTYSATNNSVHAQYDVNHSVGTNQGFVISAPGGVVTISNKGGMTAAQSGDVLFEFFR